MDRGLTPIKVPGKRKYAPKGSALQSSKKLKAAPKWLGRPFNPKTSSCPSSTSSSRSSTPSSPHKAHHRSMKRLKSKRAMSALERLPTEILERVFSYAMNFEMPRASPVLAGKLSSRYILVETVIAAFGPTWEHRYAYVKRGGFDLWQSVLEGVSGDPRMQSAVLRCRWSSLEILRAAEAMWLRRKAIAEEKRIKEEVLAAEQVSAGSEGSGSSVSGVVRTPASGSANGESQLWSRWFGRTADDLFDDDYFHLRLIAGASNTDQNKWIPGESWKLNGFLSVHPGIDIPDTLLRGPWTDDMVQYLFWLFRAGARIRWLESTSGEVAAAGLETAIEEGNLLVLFMFHCFGVQQCLTLAIITDALRSGKGDRLAVMTRLMVMALDKDDDGLVAAWDHQLAILSGSAARKNHSSSALSQIVMQLGKRWDYLRCVKRGERWDYLMSMRDSYRITLPE